MDVAKVIAADVISGSADDRPLGERIRAALATFGQAEIAEFLRTEFGDAPMTPESVAAKVSVYATRKFRALLR
ncbi:MAG TPA: hypothetical protein PLS95_13770 [Thermoanaerobaculales bacterium]|nr:hypothetical protein [Thermoanaerobaculales bacterium]